MNSSKMLEIPDKVINLLRNGKPVAAEVAASRPDFCAFVMVIPQVPNPHENPEAWIHWGHKPYPVDNGGILKLRDPSLISGYEVRYLEHHAKYTDEDWGWDYDYVLDDVTTRVKRVFVMREDEIEVATAEWLKDLSLLQELDGFNSSLVNSPIDSYLSCTNERPHLWL